MDPKGSELLYEELERKDKEYAVFPATRHVIIRGEGSERDFSPGFCHSFEGRL